MRTKVKYACIPRIEGTERTEAKNAHLCSQAYVIQRVKERADALSRIARHLDDDQVFQAQT